jgi:hypothetical protein
MFLPQRHPKLNTISQCPRPSYCEEFLTPLPTTVLEDHNLSAVRYCLFSIFAATFHHVITAKLKQLCVCVCVRVRVSVYTICYWDYHYHDLHHHVQKGLGVFPFP